MRNIDTVLLLMARARILQKALKREERLLNRRFQSRSPTLPEGWAFLTYLNLYLASAHVLIEAWDRALVYDEDVAALLDAQFRRRLRRFRNAVFHAGPFDDEPIKEVYSRLEDSRDQADRLLDAVSRFVNRELAERRVAKLRAPA